jgi:cold shock CspA family protein
MDLEKIRQDYQDFLKEYGFTQELVDVFLEMETIEDNDKSLVEIKDSEIAGKGVFLIRDVSEGEYVGMGKVDGKRVTAGRYTNHSPNPNAIFVPLENTDVEMRAICSLKIGQEVTVDYRQAAKATGYNK